MTVLVRKPLVQVTRVVCLKNAPAQGEYVYIGRAGQGESGYFGNRHPMGKPCPVPSCQDVIHSRTSAIAAFRGDFYERIRTDPEFKSRVEAMRGKALACPGNCKPRPCHGDVYVEYLEGGL